MLRSRRLVGPLLLAAVLTLPATAAAAPPARSTESFASTSCGPVPSGDDIAVVELVVRSSSESDLQIAVWVDGADPSVDTPRYVTDWVPAETTSLSGGTFSASSTIYDLETLEPAGSGRVSGTIDTSGDRITFDERFESGNWFTRTKGFLQLGVLDPGLLVIDLAGDDLTFDLSGCDGRYGTISEHGTQPSAYVEAGSSVHLDCTWTTAYGPVILEADAGADGVADVDLFADDIRLFGFAFDGSMTSAGVSAGLTLFDGNTFQELPDPATLEGTFQLVDTEVARLVHQTGSTSVVFELYDVTGSLFIPHLDLSLDLADCAAYSEAFRLKLGDPQGPQGKPLANDTPAGATDVRLGQTLRGTTVGSTFEPEVEASCVQDTIFGDAIFGNTVWFAFQGTGDAVTVDTAGSQFDTAFAVYEVDGGLTEVACADNVATGSLAVSLQAATTLLTDEGTTYLVQLGGILGEEDRFVLALR